jgi:hypothetical protein
MAKAQKSRTPYQLPIRYFLYLDTSELSADKIETVLDCIAGIYGGDINVPVSIWDVQEKRSRGTTPLLGFYFEKNHLLEARLFAWEELADFGRTGVTLYPTREIREIFRELFTTFKYFKMVDEDDQR